MCQLIERNLMIPAYCINKTYLYPIFIFLLIDRTKRFVLYLIALANLSSLDNSILLRSWNDFLQLNDVKIREDVFDYERRFNYYNRKIEILIRPICVLQKLKIERALRSTGSLPKIFVS